MTTRSRQTACATPLTRLFEHCLVVLKRVNVASGSCGGIDTPNWDNGQPGTLFCVPSKPLTTSTPTQTNTKKQTTASVSVSLSLFVLDTRNTNEKNLTNTKQQPQPPLKQLKETPTTQATQTKRAPRTRNTTANTTSTPKTTQKPSKQPPRRLVEQKQDRGTLLG